MRLAYYVCLVLVCIYVIFLEKGKNNTSHSLLGPTQPVSLSTLQIIGFVPAYRITQYNAAPANTPSSLWAL